ncbi:hypothetical protein SRCM100623_02811 [Acetobacter pasteurianus]|uniref:Uncharacterized protein n=1 Tax=Acetobacter pasteurianus TaxID=438 RepID=A0A1A0CE09_ACEPA|nr:hypothetical protein [Acetobacter pasteurianus]OAZ61308.1 hypothetical protein SRCM100623_02811 [Acetobacter pasteurianus]
MKFFPLIETAANSGQFQLSGAAVEAESTTAALALIAPTVGVGLRYGAWLYHEVRGLPDFSPVTDAEKSKSYAVLAQVGGTDQPWVEDGQQLVSTLCDASNLCLSMSQYMGFRLGLMPTDEKPVAAPATSGAEATPASSGTESTATPAS